MIPAIYFLRRLILWTLFSLLCAVPSVLIAGIAGFNVYAMILCLILCGACYAIVSRTAWFQQFKEKPFVAKTLKIGYVTRVIICVVFPAGMFVDILVGLCSVSPIGFNPTARGPFNVGFAPTLLVSIIHTLLLHFTFCIYMYVIYRFQCLICKVPNQAGYCGQCGYNLTGNISGICPECGTKIPPLQIYEAPTTGIAV